ncbi:MAG: PilN domain-containing protein [Bacteroidetes bacterium]|nr:PilN domain-containing protein [Bacteroidota bacterium]
MNFGKSGFYAVAAAAGIILMLLAVTVYQKSQLATLNDNIDKAKQRAAMLQKDIQLVDGLTDVKRKISARMSAVESLDSHRSAWVRILEDINRNVPEFVWLGRFTEKDAPPDTSQAKAKAGEKSAETPVDPAQPIIHPVEVEGYAFTLNALASFMINTMRSEYFENVELVSTKEITLGEYKAYNFVLSCNLHYLSDEELRGLIAQAEDSRVGTESTSHKSLN